MLPDYIMDRQSPDKKLHVSAASNVTVGLNQRHIFVTGASNPRTIINLPNVSEAEGLTFFIDTEVVAATAGVHVVFSNGGVSSLSQSIETATVSLSLHSTGKVWTVNRGT